MARLQVQWDKVSRGTQVVGDLSPACRFDGGMAGVADGMGGSQRPTLLLEATGLSSMTARWVGV